jgi:hypothetical protein
LQIASARRARKALSAAGHQQLLQGDQGDNVSKISASLSAFMLLGVVSTVDDCYHGAASGGMQPVRQPDQASNPAFEEENAVLMVAQDFLSVYAGQGTIFSEIRQDVRDLTSVHRCWRKIDRHDELTEGIARLCTAIAGPF